MTRINHQWSQKLTGKSMLIITQDKRKCINISKCKIKTFPVSLGLKFSLVHTFHLTTYLTLSNDFTEMKIFWGGEGVRVCVWWGGGEGEFHG